MLASRYVARQLIRRQSLQPSAESIPGLPTIQNRTLSCRVFSRFISTSRSATSFLYSRLTSPTIPTHSTQLRFNSSIPHTSQSFPDPSRSDLFYHIVQAPTPISKTLPAYALSFFPQQPPSSASTTIIGWLPAQENLSLPTSSGGNVTLADFVANPAFVQVLHSAIRDGLIEGVDEIQKATAMQTIQGWMHLHDQRNIPALNRIGDPDDIIGSVLVENSEILAETYQPMPAYRLVTADGLMQLTPGLAQKLKDVLGGIAEKEKAELSS
ncbi:hypothetical protein NP233_g180 [Leucocoprinus birnbaumii]|uniref:Uncharacterized protein n=1 Tax=Leucocoprinus birnbaumii TaxID=56174 RepID=A0AAD5YWX0_9AGAR|nr:hypothetical protein NP233_g180 [Leucocoprinus birnbaumii]